MPAKRLSVDEKLPALTKSRRPRETRMVLALRCPPPTGCSQHAHCIGSVTVPAALHKRRHDACSHATGPRYAMLGPARPSPVSCCMMYHWAIAVHLCERPSSSFGSFASSHPKPASQPRDDGGSARTCHGCRSSSRTVSYSPPNHA